MASILCRFGLHIWYGDVYDSGPGYPVCWTRRCRCCPAWMFWDKPRRLDNDWPDHVKQAYLADDDMNDERTINNNPSGKPFCCFLGCNADAEWEIHGPDGLEDFTQSCTRHIGDLMHPDGAHVYPLREVPR